MNKSSKSSVEGRSTLSVLTNFYKKEESRRKAREDALRNDRTSASDEHVPLPSRTLASVPPFNNRQNVSSNQSVLVHEANEPPLHSKPTSLPLKKRTYILHHGEQQQEENVNRQGQDGNETNADDVGGIIKKHTSGQIKKKRLAKDDANEMRQVENGIACRTSCADGFNSKSTNKDIVACESSTACSTSADTVASSDWNESQYKRFCQQQQDGSKGTQATNIEEPNECIASIRDMSYQPKSSSIVANETVTNLSKESATVDTRDSTTSLVDVTATATTMTTADVDSNKSLDDDDDDEFASLLMDTAPKKRKRLRLVGKSTTRNKRLVTRKSLLAQSARYDDTMWINSDIQGLVETQELPTIESVPIGENPWAHLWQPGAEPFELNFVFSQERRRQPNTLYESE